MAAETQPSLATILREWGRIGIIGFGGPPAHIALFRDLCVVRRHWLSAEQFEDAIAATNLLPGPGSTQLAIFCAWRLRGVRGALLGGAGFIVPGLVAILALSVLFLASAPPTWVIGAGAGAGRGGRRGRGQSRARLDSRQLGAGEGHAPAALDSLRSGGPARDGADRPLASAHPVGLRRLRADATASRRRRRGTEQLDGRAAGGDRDGWDRRPGLDGLQGRRPLLRRRLRDRSADAGRRGQPLPLDDLGPISQRGGARPGDPRPGGAHGRRGRLRGSGDMGRHCSPQRSPSRPRSPSS